jgi:hypothetical protein
MAGTSPAMTEKMCVALLLGAQRRSNPHPGAHLMRIAASLRSSQ